MLKIKSVLFSLFAFFILSFTVTCTSSSAGNYKKATFAGGCFWCMQPPYDKLKGKGIISVIVGYSGGTGENPTYHNYAKKGYIEAIQVTYNPGKISYKKLLNIFWRQIDPTDAYGQFVDRGKHYRSAIFYHSSKQKKTALMSKKQISNSGRFQKPIVTEIIRYKNFYPAEDYHQSFYKKNPQRYYSYRRNSGRDEYLKKKWDNE